MANIHKAVEIYRLYFKGDYMKKFQIDEEVLEDLCNICEALVSITEIECCSYNFDEEVTKAEYFIESYEKFKKGE